MQANREAIILEYLTKIKSFKKELTKKIFGIELAS
jgi:hypothetical protein